MTPETMYKNLMRSQATLGEIAHASGVSIDDLWGLLGDKPAGRKNRRVLRAVQSFLEEEREKRTQDTPVVSYCQSCDKQIICPRPRKFCNSVCAKRYHSVLRHAKLKLERMERGVTPRRRGKLAGSDGKPSGRHND